MAALRSACDMDTIDNQKLTVFGGSHGGFLTGHLIGQHGARFKAAVLANPVLNVSWMAGVTDIPDWCYVETGLPYSPASHQNIPTAQDYVHMFAASPIAYVERVTTPTLLQIGLNDRRVPVHQSLEYYKILKARGVPVRLSSYPGSQHHLADKVSIEADAWINTTLWMTQNLK
eukprot:TRINITY_DN4538_c0_g1_i5.p1 TRINITY_DN4538_c0_g1~~TRINITY_DN4538_c0_g1_i5.p1  ORF type:complete len:173 (-),score=38.96 TRINITY_DN4538_c0_g1_i5:51-569(-)